MMQCKDGGGGIHLSPPIKKEIATTHVRLPQPGQKTLLIMSIHSITNRLEDYIEILTSKVALLLDAGVVQGNTDNFREYLQELLAITDKLQNDLKSLLQVIDSNKSVTPSLTKQQLSLVTNNHDQLICHDDEIELAISIELSTIIEAVINILTKSINSHLVDILKDKRMKRLPTSKSFSRDITVTMKYITNIQSKHLLNHASKLTELSQSYLSSSFIEEAPSSHGNDIKHGIKTKSDKNDNQTCCQPGSVLLQQSSSIASLQKDNKVAALISVPDPIWREEPTHHELMEILSDISYQWSELGDCLHVKHGELGSLRRSSLSNNEKLSEVLQKWKEQEDPPYTWSTLAEILSGPVIANRRLSKDMESFLYEKKVITPLGSPQSTRKEKGVTNCSSQPADTCTLSEDDDGDNLTDKDLLRCSRYIDRDPTSLCGYLGFPDDTLEDIRRKNKKVTVQAHCLLKKWKENNPTSNKQQLSDIMECLGFNKAAKSVFADV